MHESRCVDPRPQLHPHHDPDMGTIHSPKKRVRDMKLFLGACKHWLSTFRGARSSKYSLCQAGRNYTDEI